MNIYSLIPLIATIAYIPLLVTTASTRPWKRQHRLFLLFLISACLWSLLDYIWRSNYYPELVNELSRVVIFLFAMMAVQFHCFTSSFFPPDRSRWLPFAYGFLLVIIAPLVLGYVPQSVILIDQRFKAHYGLWILLIAIPLLVLLVRNLYILVPRLKNRENPVNHNQTQSLVIGLGVLAVFMITAILPFGSEFPIGHLGNIVIALIMSYAVVGHQLVDIRFVLRRGFVWLSIAVIGLACYWGILLLLHSLFNVELTREVMFIASVSGITSFILSYKIRDLVGRVMGKAFQGESYRYREKLVEFAGRIQNVFSLKEQGGELLSLVTHAVGCEKAGLMFLDASEGYEIQLMEPAIKNPMENLKFRNDNPIVQYLKKEARSLTRDSIVIMPEFLGLWQQEKESIDASGVDLIIPLISRKRLIGILVLDKKRSGHYTLEDYNLLEEVTGQAAVSMEKEYLREQLKEREEELSVINRSNTIITSSLDIQRIYDSFIKELKRVVDVNWAAIAVIEEEELLFMAVSTEIGSPWNAGERIPLKGTATEWVAEHRKPIIDTDLTIETRFTTGKYHLQHGIRSIAYLPLVISNQVIGTLTVASRNSDAYASKHLKLLEQLASQIAMPIENARLYAKTERLARVDSLTGLLNRRSLDEALLSEIGRHSRYGGIFSLIILDLDSFKSLNDNYGHLAGDELLRQIGSIIKGTIREADQAFRYGGDEYAILLPHTSIESACKVAERIRQKTFAKIVIGSIPISVSLGLASWPADGVGPYDIVAAADAALYRAKRNGGNRAESAITELSHEVLSRSGSFDSQMSSDLGTIFSLATTVDTRAILNRNHSKQVHDYAIAIGESIGLDQLEINRLGTCALLHDIGKIGISDEILNKENSLTDQEWEIVKSHPKLGATIISHSSQLTPCIQGILHHHERFDGQGYPDGLKGEEIPLESRILAIADAFSVITSTRAYSHSLTFEEAREEIKKGSGSQFDPKLVDVFLAAIRRPVESVERSKLVETN